MASEGTKAGDLGVIELSASYWSVSGDVYAGGPDEVSPFEFRRRVEVASRTGFRGMGFVHADLMANAALLGFPTMKRILDDNGIRYVEVEIIMDWFTDGERRARSDVVRRDLLRAAEALGACHIKVGGILDLKGDSAWPMDGMARDFAVLCSQARDAGTRVAIELMPFTNLRTIKQGVELIHTSGTDNGGLMLDIWHIARGNVDFDDILRMPKELIYWVEIDDADRDIVDDLWVDTIHHRRLPGEGTLDIQGFLARIDQAGYRGPFGVEIIAQRHRVLPLEEAARRVFDTAMNQFRIAADRRGMETNKAGR